MPLENETTVVNETNDSITPEDVTEKTTTETVETNDNETVEETNTEPQIFLSVKHKNSVVPLSKEEAEEAAQLGLFLKEEDGVESLKWFRSQAKAAGVSLGEYRKSIEKGLIEIQAQKLIEERGLPEEEAIELAESRAEKATKKIQNEQELDQQQLEAEVTEFNSEYPDVDVTNLPQEVLIAKKNNPNKSITDLYMRYERKQQQAANSLLEKQQQNKQSETGSLKATESDKDNFFAELDSIILKK